MTSVGLKPGGINAVRSVLMLIAIVSVVLCAPGCVSSSESVRLPELPVSSTGEADGTREPRKAEPEAPNDREREGKSGPKIELVQTITAPDSEETPGPYPRPEPSVSLAGGDADTAVAAKQPNTPDEPRTSLREPAPRDSVGLEDADLALPDPALPEPPEIVVIDARDRQSEPLEGREVSHPDTARNAAAEVVDEASSAPQADSTPPAVAAPRSDTDSSSSSSPGPTELPRAAIKISRTGITVPVSLAGFGWIYTPEEIIDGYAYVGRDLSESGSLFSFRVLEPRNYELRFQRQDNATGTIEIAVVELLAADAIDAPNDQVAAMDSSREESATETDEELLANARNDAKARRYDLALESYDELMRRDRVEFALEAGRAAYDGSYFDRAIELLVLGFEDLAADDRYAAARLMIDSASKGGAPASIRPVLGTLLAEGVLRYREDFIGLSEVFASVGDVVSAIDVLEHAAELFGEGPTGDEICFALAHLYETESPMRDERVAYQWYERIVEGFPMSRHYEAAATRMSYIERHYLDIR